MPSPASVERIISKVEANLHYFESFHSSVETFFKSHPLLKTDPPVVHSIKGRIKNLDHLREKIDRKFSGNEINEENVFSKITDIAGLRLMHLYQNQFPTIHKCITDEVEKKNWALYEQPKAYSWDPDSVEFFNNLGLESNVRESLYTSVHYVVQPNANSEVTCEIQVRTLFEEIWGEIEHQINYPRKTEIKSAKEQIGVLARLVGAGTRLADSIFLAVEDHKELPEAGKKQKTRKLKKQI